LASERPRGYAEGVLSPKRFFEALAHAGIGFFAGVPDSLLKDFCAFVTDHAPRERHVITVNEGSAIALAMGHHLATGEAGLVYMQNSGLGNAVNPLTSLASPDVYGIPMLLVIGWRGEPGVKDEPQHVQMGRVTEAVLDAIDVPHAVLPHDDTAAEAVVLEAKRRMAERSGPYALLVQKGTFEPYTLQKNDARTFEMTREQAIACFVRTAPPGSIIVSTTGMPSRELFEVREQRGEPHASDFLTVGGMGHASQIALGLALARPDRRVYCLDGDGAVLMHMGGLATIADLAPANYRHVVLNNGAHDSVGGQPTVALVADLSQAARAAGYRHARSVETEPDLTVALRELAGTDGPALVEVRVQKGNRKDLGRPTMTPADLKSALMNYVATDAVD
jgi:phosphonopyruvate decarboxylase